MVLHLSPNFARLGEVYLKMAVAYTRLNKFKQSMEYFKKALTICGPASFGKLESKC